jgi:hypothetical protein
LDAGSARVFEALGFKAIANTRFVGPHFHAARLRRGEASVDACLGQDWLTGPHQSNLEQARHSSV